MKNFLSKVFAAAFAFLLLGAIPSAFATFGMLSTTAILAEQDGPMVTIFAEVSGFMLPGINTLDVEVNWGDGNIETMDAAGDSGDTFYFEALHLYTDSFDGMVEVCATEYDIGGMPDDTACDEVAVSFAADPGGVDIAITSIDIDRTGDITYDLSNIGTVDLDPSDADDPNEIAFIYGTIDYSDGSTYIDWMETLTSDEPDSLPSLDSAPYPDVAADHALGYYIDEMTGEGLFEGYDNGNFGPDDPMTVRQMELVLSRFTGEDVQIGGPDDDPMIRSYFAEVILEYAP